VPRAAPVFQAFLVQLATQVITVLFQLLIVFTPVVRRLNRLRCLIVIASKADKETFCFKNLILLIV